MNLASAGVTPKNFYLAFSNFYLIWGRLFKNFLLKNSPSQKSSFLTSILFGFTQDLVFGLGGFSILCWLITNVFHSEKKLLKIFSFKIALWLLGVILPLSKTSSCHDMSGNPLPKAIPHLCVKIYFKSSKLNSPMIFLPFISYQKYFLPSTLALGDLQRNYLFSFEFCLQTIFPG